MLGHIGGSTAIFTAKRQALQEAQGHEQERRKPADCRKGRQEANREGRNAHHHHGDEEGVFPADHVAKAAKHQGAEGAHQEACGIGCKSREQGRRIIPGREEKGGEKRRQCGVEIEIIPFENGTGG